MRVRCLPQNDRHDNSNVYLLLGDWSRIDDVTTLIDVGADRTLMPFIQAAPTGVGKKRVDLVMRAGARSTR